MIHSKLFTNIMLLLYILGFHLNAQNVPAKLPATNIIGTTESVDYSDNSISSTVNTRNNAFDGNINTFFAAYQRSGGWVGLDLGEKHVITKVAYSSRKDWPQRLLLGVFEGANMPDFGDAIPFCLVTATPQNNIMTEQAISCSRGFRYVRYIGPDNVRCNIAEIEFYGYLGEGDDSKLYQTTNLPDIIIHTKNAADIVEKEVYLKGIVSIISENGTKIYADSLDIRGRGNASWGFPKKPYRMKLYNKTNVLGLPAKEKNWTLINNYGDKSLMRNLLAFDLSQRLEMPYTPAGKPVNVYLNGQYKGCYQLCDHMEVAKNRIDVDKMDVNDVTLPNLSGGYLVEIDAYAYQEISWFNSQKGVPVTIKYPKDDEIVSGQSNYIRTFFNQMETALFSSTYKDPTTGYRKYMDMETFIRHFLVGELSGNTDTYWSVYMYKKRNNDKFYFGPVWDFDLAYENDYRTYPINNNPDWIYASTGSAAYNVKSVVNRLFSDAEFINQLKSIYAHYRTQGILSEEVLLAVVDNYAEQLEASQKLNFTRWNILNSTVHMNPRTYGSYAGEVANVKNFIRERLQWMDKKLAYNVATSATYNDFKDISIWAQANIIHVKNVTVPTKIEIFTMVGNLLYSAMIYGDIDIPFQSGIFIIRCTSQKGNIKVIKCIIQ